MLYSSGVLQGVLISFCRFGALFFITTNQCFSTLSAAELFITERKLFMYVPQCVCVCMACHAQVHLSLGVSGGLLDIILMYCQYVI